MGKNQRQIINSLLVELNLKFDAYIEHLIEDSRFDIESTRYWEEVMIKLQVADFRFKSAFVKQLLYYLKKIKKIETQHSNARTLFTEFHNVKGKFRLLIIKKQLKDYLETCEAGSNFYLLDGRKRIIGFTPSLPTINALNKLLTLAYDL